MDSFCITFYCYILNNLFWNFFLNIHNSFRDYFNWDLNSDWPIDVNFLSRLKNRYLNFYFHNFVNILWDWYNFLNNSWNYDYFLNNFLNFNSFWNLDYLFNNFFSASWDFLDDLSDNLIEFLMILSEENWSLFLNDVRDAFDDLNNFLS